MVDKYGGKLKATEGHRQRQERNGAFLLETRHVTQTNQKSRGYKVPYKRNPGHVHITDRGLAML